MRDKRELLAQDNPEGAWEKSSFSGGGSGSDCLEVLKVDGGVILRDSEDPDGAKIALWNSEYAAFVKGVQANESGLVP